MKYIGQISDNKDIVNKEYVDNSIDDIQIGGRNLVLNSSIEKSLTKTADSAAVIGSRYDLSDYGMSNLPIGTTVTISIEAKATLDNVRINPYVNNKAWNVTCEQGKDSQPITTNWVRYSWTFQLTQENAAKVQITANTFVGSSGVTYYIRNIKCEIGNKATDYTPAPEDLVDIYSDQTIIGNKVLSGVTNFNGITNVNNILNSQNIIPTNDNVYYLGSQDKSYSYIYSKNMVLYAPSGYSYTRNIVFKTYQTTDDTNKYKHNVTIYQPTMISQIGLGLFDVNLGSSGTTVAYYNDQSNTFTFNQPIYSNDILPNSVNTRNIGSASSKWLNVYANNFIGNADTSYNPFWKQIDYTSTTPLDMNDYVTEGFYRCAYTGNTATFLNMPVANPQGFTLEIKRIRSIAGATIDWCIQQIFTNRADYSIYVRYYYVNGSGNGLWSDWKKQLDSGNYNSYSPKLDGTGATGTWGIDINGNANSASKLTTSAGSTTQPVYFSNGIPISTTYSLGKSVPSNAVFTDTVYTHPTTSGNKHIPTGGSSGQILRWSADGTATWGTDNDTTYSVFSTTSDGLVPKRVGSTSTKFLREDGTWVIPTNTTYSVATTSANGLMSAAMVTKLNGITDSADAVSFTSSLTSGTKIGTITINGTGTDLYCQTNDNTDTKVTNTLATTTKAYLTGTTSSTTNTGTQVFDTGVYLSTNAGYLCASFGYNLVDNLGTEFGGVKYLPTADSGAGAMYIGTQYLGGTHHKGKLYISSGYDANSTLTNATGNDSVFINIPEIVSGTKSNNSYPILHSGNYANYAVTLSTDQNITGQKVFSSTYTYIGDSSNTTSKSLRFRTTSTTDATNLYDHDTMFNMAAMTSGIGMQLYDNKNATTVWYYNDSVKQFNLAVPTYAQNLYPKITDTYNLGSSTYRWNNGNIKTLNSSRVSIIDDTDITAYGSLYIKPSTVQGARGIQISSPNEGTQCIYAYGVESTSTTTGAVVVNGGTGISGKLYVGGDTYQSGNLYVGGDSSSGNIIFTNTPITAASISYKTDRLVITHKSSAVNLTSTSIEISAPSSIDINSSTSVSITGSSLSINGGWSTGSGTPAYINTNGTLVKYSSSRRYKTNFNYDIDRNKYHNELMLMKPLEYSYKSSLNLTERGMIAEDVEKINNDLVVYDNNTNLAESYKDRDIITMLIVEAQEKDKIIKELSDKINKLIKEES